MGGIETVDVEVGPGVFRPTATSRELIRGVSRNIVVPGRILDLGCGCGVVGATLHRAGKAVGPVCGSDVSAEAVASFAANCARLGVPADARLGSLYAPWKDETFDYIVDDVSGIAEEVAALSPWFDGVPCESGDDGTELVVEAIRAAPGYLRPGGKFFFPVLTLSDAAKIVACAREIFSTVTCLSTMDWPNPPELKPHERRLRELRDRGLVSFQEKFGYLIMSTSIYVGSVD